MIQSEYLVWPALITNTDECTDFSVLQLIELITILFRNQKVSTTIVTQLDKNFQRARSPDHNIRQEVVLLSKSSAD